MKKRIYKTTLKERLYSRERNKRFALRNPEKMQEYLKRRTKNGKANHASRKSSYGLNKKQFKQMIKEQKNKCAICSRVFSKTPYVDHCHRTRKIRGLLCLACNSGLGFFKDNSKILLKAFKYLKKGLV